MKHYETALVLGLGSSGAAASRLLLKEGAAVSVIDQCRNRDLVKRASELQMLGASIVLGGGKLPPPPGRKTSRMRKDFDICVTSPGIPSDSKWIRDLETRGVQVISELELGASRCRCPILAITGSKGKSTLTKLCAEAISIAGKRSTLAGNYGIPLCRVASRTSRLDWVVVEVSSFQLEKVQHFMPRVGVVLNIQPDHLDRHGNMQSYTELKSRIFAGTDKNCAGVVLDKDAGRIISVARGRNRWVTFGLSKHADYRYKAGWIIFKEGRRSRRISVAGTMFDNKVLGVAAGAAVAAVTSCGMPAHAVEKAIRSFKPLPHRMSEVRKMRGVRFINDSKATSLTAMCAGVEMCGGPVRLIVGGLLKEKNLGLAKKVLERRVRSVYLIGRSSKMMKKAWRNIVPCHECGRLGKAVHSAFADAQAGEAILLSPGCASFDQFKNFEDRGCQFTKMVRSINKEK